MKSTSKNPILDIGNQILDSNNMIELAHNLLEFAQLSAIEYTNEIYQTFYKMLLERLATGGSHNHYRILKNSQCIPTLLLNIWFPHETLGENISHWNGIAEDLVSEYRGPKGIQIDESQVDAVMQHLERRYEFCSKLLKAEPANILLLPNSHINYNGQYAPPFEGSKLPSGSDAVIMLYIYKTGISPEAVLLHELGHLLHSRLTGAYGTPPESFEYIQKKMFPTLEGCPKEERAEYFADCFAMAAIQNSTFSPHDYFSHFRQEDKDIMCEYFSVLINTINLNENGMLPWLSLKSILESKYRCLEHKEV